MVDNREARILKAQASRSAGGLGARSRMEAEFLVDREDALAVADDLAAAAYDAYVVAEDDANAVAYAAYVAEIVRSAWANRTKVDGSQVRGPYYDTTTYVIHVDPALGLDAAAVRKIVSSRDGESMASYGSFGGYSTIGTVALLGDPGAFSVESVYHIGD